LYIISFCFIGTGVLLLASLRRPEGEKTCSTMSFLDGIIIGCSQAVAILPGLSRSGTTIVTGLFCKLKREEAATFSFLLSIPVIAGSGLLELKDLLKEQDSSGGVPAWLLLVGMLVSCGVGLLSLTWLLDWLKKGKLWYFALWVFLMAPVTLALAVIPIQEKQEAEKAEKVLVKDSIQSAEPTDESPETDSLKAAIENVEDTGREKMGDEEVRREYEKILAEEEAKEQALIAEEQKRVPLVDEPEKLVPLDPKDRIWITPDGKSVVTLGRIALREGLLELFACRIGTKEHESIVSVRVKPLLIHAALLAVGAEAGKPVQVSPEFAPPSGDEIEVVVRWNNENGERKESLAQDWVWDVGNSEEDAKKAMSTHWVFTGSMQYKDESGENHYVADETGELFGVSNFVGAILDVPIKSSADNAELLFACFTERIPERGTPLTLILTPVKNKKR
jgi:hypothetical protein